MKLISMNIPPNLYDQAKQIAEEQGVSVAALLRLALSTCIREYLKNAKA